jgi:hypothetical protein
MAPALSSFVLANNALVDLHAASLAEALRTNRHLLRLDPAGPFNQEGDHQRPHEVRSSTMIQKTLFIRLR